MVFGLRSFFSDMVNVAEYLKICTRLIEPLEHPDELRHNLKKISSYLNHISRTHKRSMKPAELSKLCEIANWIDEHCRILKRRQVDFDQLKGGFQRRSRDLNRIFDTTAVYLLRHADKPGKADKDMKHLSRDGVRQAKKFAEYFSEEVLLCPKPVRVIFRCSEMRRTYLFAEVVKRKLNQLKETYNKDVEFSTIYKDKALGFRFTEANLAEIDDDYSKRGEFVAFKKWVKGEYSKDVPGARKIAGEIEQWLRTGARQPSNKYWIVVIGVSHSFIIDSFLYHKVGDHDHIITLADLVKVSGKELCYRSNWHGF